MAVCHMTVTLTLAFYSMQPNYNREHKNEIINKCSTQIPNNCKADKLADLICKLRDRITAFLDKSDEQME